MPWLKRRPKAARRSRSAGVCSSRDWAGDPSLRCQRPDDGHKTHVWHYPGTGRGDDKTFYWKDLG